MRDNVLLFSICLIFSVFIFSGNVLAGSFSDEEFTEKREAMVEYLISSHDITDEKVLQAMGKVKRHKFVKEQFRGQAYEEIGLPIGYDQKVSLLHRVALMIQALELKGNEKVLEIGTGSGYQTAVLAEIAKNVYTIEIIEELAKTAEARLDQLGYSNIKVKCGDGFIGWKEFAPYDAIIVSVASDRIPSYLTRQLAEGGMMTIPLITGEHQEIQLLRKIKGRIIRDSVSVKGGPPHFMLMMGKHTGIPVPTEK